MIGIALSMQGNPSQVTVIQQAIAVLRKFGTDAHIYLPGVGMLNGLTAANYLDSAGTTAGTVDQPVGLVLDAAGGLGVELVTNPTFSSGGAGWTVSFWTLSTGSASCASLAGGNLVYQTGLLSSGKVYQFTYTVSSVTLGGVCAYANGNQGPTRTVAGTYTETLSAAAANNFLAISTVGTTTATVTNISVREVTGIHASQPTTASKPILRRGAVNLLTYSGDFGNAAWTKVSTAITTSMPDPYGGTLASRHVTTSSGYEFQSYSSTPGTAYTFAFTVKNNGGVDARYAIWNAISALFIVPSTSYVSQVSEWATVVVNFTAPAGCTGLRCYPLASDADVLLYRAALFQGTYTAAQIQALGGIPLTSTAPASTALGPQYWQFDGSNDSLSLGGPLFQMADDHCVVAGAKCDNAVSDNQIFSQRGAGSLPIVGQLGFTAGVPDAVWRDDSGVISRPSGGVSRVGQTVVLANRKVGNDKSLWVNGVQAGISSTPIGAATLTLYGIGSSTKATDFMSGNIYPIVATKGAMTDAEFILINKLVANLSGVTL